MAEEATMCSMNANDGNQKNIPKVLQLNGKDAADCFANQRLVWVQECSKQHNWGTWRMMHALPRSGGAVSRRIGSRVFPFFH